MNEWIQIGVMLWALGLMAAGGTDLNGRGYKWLRRFVMPIGLGALALLYAPWWACLGYTVTISAFLHMGYGSKATWLYRTAIFTGYGAASLWLGWSWWTVITPPVCLGLFFLSNWRPVANSFTWKLIESGYGFLIGACYISAILNKW